MPAADGTGVTVCVTARLASPGFGIQLTIAPPDVAVNADPVGRHRTENVEDQLRTRIERVVGLHEQAGRRLRRERQPVHREMRHQAGVVDRQLHRLRREPAERDVVEPRQRAAVDRQRRAVEDQAVDVHAAATGTDCSPRRR